MCVAKEGSGAMDLQKLSVCVVGDPRMQTPQYRARSQILLMQNALATAELGKSRQWVPWLTINGRTFGIKRQKMFLIGSKVCSAYTAETGKHPPAVCATFITEPPADGHFYDPLKGTPFAAPEPPKPTPAA